jgi:hypothetical protein
MKKGDRGLVEAVLFDVYRTYGGFGKHGNGPFATERQARACLRAHPWEGSVQLVKVSLEPERLERIRRRGLEKPRRRLAAER